MIYPEQSHRRLLPSFLLACGLLSPGTASAEIFEDEFRAIAGETNEALITIDALDPRTSTIEDCDGGPSQLFLSLDTTTSEVTLEDGELCGSDVAFLATLQDIVLAIGATADALDDDPTHSYPSVTAAIGPENTVVFEDLPVYFQATVVLGPSTSDVSLRFVEDLSGRFELDEVSGRLVLVDVSGSFLGALDLDGPGPAPPHVVQADLTLNLESSGPGLNFEIFDDGFEGGDLTAWSETSGRRR